MADRRAGNCSIGQRGRSKLESGTCNVCSAPCSSCRHHDDAGFTGSMSQESSGENSHGVVASQCSFNEDDLLPSSRVNTLGNTASEASNLVNSTHDTSSEHSESQEVVRSSDHQARNIPRVGENILLNKAEEPNTSAMSESECADSEVHEVDVKICDTCGDAGREDLLAVCSRCSDGAEHTYCMRIMLEEVPSSDWLCEECKFAEEAEKKKRGKETRRQKETEVNLNTQSSSKRHIDKPESAPDAKRQAVEAPTGSPKRPVLPKLFAFSRETSLKGLEKTTRKLAHHSSFNSHSSDDTDTDSQLQSPKACAGSLFKSNSFNCSSSRPKVRPVDDVMPKEGVSRKLGRSMSTRCIDVGSSGCNESKLKGSKQLKDRNTEAYPLASAVDQKLISRGNSSSSYANSARDLKSLQSDGKQGSLTKKARHLSRNRLEDIVASVGDTYTNEKSKDAVGCRQRSDTFAVSKDQTAEPAEPSCASGSNLSTTRNIKEDTNKGNRLRAAVDAALRRKPSFSKNRGLEQSDLPSVSNVDSSCDRALQNFHSKVPVVRDWPVGLQGVQTDKQAIAVNRKQFTLAGADAVTASQSAEPAVHLSSVKPVIREWPVGLQGGQANLRTDKQTNAVNRKQFPLAGADSTAATQSVEPAVHLPCGKSVMRDLPVVDPSVLSTTPAIPEHEYIWQGDLEVQKNRNLSAVHCGMQAYLSTIASPKVAEVVNQFPVKFSLNEVPRLSTWPSQFQDRGAKEGHVALFFFAKDTESYEKSYKPLVDNMIQKDLALKGNFEGVELLIFASNQLPQKCQRWNMFFFLWGVFRGKTEKCSDPLKEENSKEGEAKVEETEEGEIGFSSQLRDEKISGPGRVNSSDMNKKVNMDGEGPANKKLKTSTGVETECSIIRRDTSASRKPGRHPCEEENMIKKNPNSTERIVFPLDLNDGKEDDVEMVDDNPRALGNDKNRRRPLGMVPNLELALGEDETTTTTGPSATEKHRSSQKAEEDNAASLSLSLSFSSLEKEQQQQNRIPVSGWEHKKQNVNTPMFLFRNFPDKSS